MKVASPIAVAIAIAIAVLVGCGGLPSEEMRRAVPTSTELRIQPPSQTEPSPYWVLTEQVAQQIDETISGPLDAVAAIIALPPDEEDADGALWLIPPEAQSPIDRRLVVRREAADHNNFQLQIKPTGSGEEAWQPYITGSVLASGGLRAGALIIDYASLHALDPVGQPTGGQVNAEWEIKKTARLHVRLDGVGPALTTAEGHLERYASGSGGLELNLVSDTVDGPALETVKIAAGWTSGGAGKASVEVRGGDSGEGIDSMECWDDSTERVFFVEHPVGGEPTPEGDPAACPP